MINMPPNTPIFIALSGGVDSAVSALLLKQQYNPQLEAVFMQNWPSDYGDPYCTAHQDLTDARIVCDRLKIPLHTVNFSADYWDRVFQHCLDQYACGNTPNPDILCNTEIKFKAFLQYAKDQGAQYIATGHYVRAKQIGKLHYLLKGKDPQKDQSYFLHGLNQKQLAASIFPLGDYSKTAVRDMAQQAGFVNYNKPDSTGLCFVGERPFKKLLQEYLLNQPGPINTDKGQCIGQHDGLMFYTIGQRKGLNIGGIDWATEDPWYVIDKDLANNTLIVGQGKHHPALFTQELICTKTHWIVPPAKLPVRCCAKIRYRQADQMCTLTEQTEDESYRVLFDQPQRAITPGQYSVFYDDDVCLGGGIIVRTDPSGTVSNR